MTLAGRMWIASAILAALVAAAFSALILAVDAQRSATAREHRSNDVTVATLQLEKLVVDMETGVRGFSLTSESHVPRAVHERASSAPVTDRRAPAARPERSATTRARACAERQINEYISDYAVLLVGLVRRDA